MAAEDEFGGMEDMGSGDTAEMQITTMSGTETESTLVILTSVFLIVAIGLLAIKLHVSYGFFKDPASLKTEESEIQQTFQYRTSGS